MPLVPEIGDNAVRNDFPDVFNLQKVFTGSGSQRIDILEEYGKLLCRGLTYISDTQGI